MSKIPDDFGFSIDLTVRNEWKNIDLLRTSVQNCFIAVFADLDGHDRFHRPLLRSLAASFGAEPIRDRSSAAWRGGSFMSDAPVSADTPPWIDPDNRSRVLRNKLAKPQ